MDEKELYVEALEKWGANAQVGMFIEEIGEVLTALNKHTRVHNGCTRDELVGELVDLHIMLEQMKVVFKISMPTFELVKQKKLERLEKMLEG